MPPPITPPSGTGNRFATTIVGTGSTTISTLTPSAPTLGVTGAAGQLISGIEMAAVAADATAVA